MTVFQSADEYRFTAYDHRVSDSLPLFLFSGLGADRRMFAKLFSPLPELTVPNWIPPIRGETLRQYARRMAEHIGPDRPCFIGGASFGAFLAMEMLPYVNAKACFLIGGVRSPAELPAWIQFLRPAKPLLRVIPFKIFWLASGYLAATIGNVLPARMREFLWLGASLDPEFFRWSAGAVLSWGEDGTPPATDVPIFQIHGRRDRVLPVKRTTPTQIISNGGHVIALSNPQEVGEFFRRNMQMIGRENRLSLQ